jgi:hypothetical protein
MTATGHAGIGTQQLSDAFTPRSAGAGKLAPLRRTSGARTPATQEEGAPVVDPTAEKREDTPRSKEAPDASAFQGGPNKQIIAYLPFALAERLRGQSEETGRTHLQLVIDALEATHDRLGELLAKAGYTEGRSSGLFGDGVQPVSRRPRRRGGVDQVTLRPSADVRKVMDELVEQFKAPNRSVLIEVALDTHLP